MGIRTGSILRETSTDRIPSRRRRQQVPEARQPLPPTSAEPLAKIIRVDPHPAMHYPPTLGSPRVPTGRLVLPSTEMPPMGDQLRTLQGHHSPPGGMEIGLHKVAQRQQSHSDESPKRPLE